MNAQADVGMEPVQFENPMGIDGFEFVEFASPEPQKLHDLFVKMGFSAVARHKTRKITTYRRLAESALAKLVLCSIMTTSLLYAGRVRRMALGKTTRHITCTRLIP